MDPINIRNEKLEQQLSKKKKFSHSHLNHLSITGSLDGERKSSLNPKKKPRTESSYDISMKGVLKKITKASGTGSKLKQPHALNSFTEDQRMKDMMSFYKARDYNEAIAIGRTVLADSPDSLDALYIVGLSSSMLDKHELTIKYFEDLLALDPQYKKNVYLFLSIAYKKIGKIDSSFEVLNKALKLFDNFFEAYVSLVSHVRSIEESCT